MINKNVYENCGKLFDRKADYNTFESSVFDLQKCMNEDAISDGVLQVYKLCDDYSNNAEKAKKYIDAILKEKEYWIQLYTNNYAHMNTITTSRVESQHAALKNNMKAIYSIERAFNIFDNTIQGQYIDIMAQIGREKI